MSPVTQAGPAVQDCLHPPHRCWEIGFCVQMLGHDRVTSWPWPAHTASLAPLSSVVGWNGVSVAHVCFAAWSSLDRPQAIGTCEADLAPARSCGMDALGLGARESEGPQRHGVPATLGRWSELMSRHHGQVRCQ